MIHKLDEGQVILIENGQKITESDTRYHFFETLLTNKLQEYKLKRQSEYPPITDYLDGIVKGDQAQIDEYIAKCQAVKAKYPKPE
jgi:hypothetical protein